MCTFPAHTPNTTYTYFLIWDSIMRIDIEMLDRLSGSARMRSIWYLVRFPIAHEVPPHIKGSLRDFDGPITISRMPTSQSIRPNITHCSALTRTRERWPSAKRVYRVRRLIFSRPRPASWIRYMCTLCIVSERLSDSIAKLIINKYYCFPYKQVDRRWVVFVAGNE